MKRNKCIAIVAFMLLGNLNGSNTKVRKTQSPTTGWWNRLKSYISYNPIISTGKLVMGGKKTVGRAVANLSLNPLDRFRNNLNVIQEEYYNSDLINVILRLEKELKDLRATEISALNQRDEKLVTLYGMKRYNAFMVFIKKIKSEILGFTASLKKLLKEEDDFIKEYEKKKSSAQTEDNDDKTEFKSATFDYQLKSH